MKRDNEHTATAAEQQRLTERFLAGETTVGEEHRLCELLKNAAVTDEERALLGILPPPADGNDIEAWLSEDETATYDAIVRHRRRRLLTARWVAAAVFIALVFVTGMFLGRNTTYTDTTENNPLTALNATPPAPDTTPLTPTATPLIPPPTTPRHTSAQAATPPATANNATKTGKATAATTATAAGMTAADSMTILVERMERDLDNLSDSVYLAHVEQIIKADERFQKLMNKILINNITRQDRPAEAHNTDNQ